MPNSIYNFKWVWQAKFFSHTYQTLEYYSFLLDEQMIFLPFFYIPTEKLENLEKTIFMAILGHFQ